MAESITQNITLTARMELKTYTVTINSGKSNGESKTYKVPQGGNWRLPECPFSPDAGRTFVNYTVSGATKNVGDEITVTSNLTVTCNWSVNLIGKEAKVRYWCSDDRNIGVAVALASYDPEVEGETITIRYYTGGSGTKRERHIELRSENINRKISIATVADEADNANDCYGAFFGQIGIHLHQGITYGMDGLLRTISYQ